MSTTRSTLRVTSIRPNHRVFDWAELWAYRDLFWFLVSREIKVRNAQTIFGFAWIVVRPLFTVVVFTVIFGTLVQMPSDGVPYSVFAFAALVPWQYFAAAVTRSTESLVSNRNMISKIYYPRVLVPMTPVVSQLVDFAISFFFVLCLAAYFGFWPGPLLLLTPLLVLIMVVTATGIGLWTSAVAVQYRDIRSAIQLVTQMMMYLAPVIWPLSLLEEKLGDSAALGRVIYGLYPMAGVIESFRAVVLESRAVPWDMLASGSCSALLLFVSGMWFFSRREPRFADVA